MPATATMGSTTSTAVEPATSTAVEPATATAVEPATAVEAAPTVESTTSVKSAATMEAGAASSEAVSCEAVPFKAASAPAAPAPAAPGPAVTPTAAPPASSPAIPGAGADEDTACKPVRPVVAVRGTGVGIVSVITVITYRRPAVIGWSDSDTYFDLRLRVRQRNHQNRQQRQIFQVPHMTPFFRSTSPALKTRQNLKAFSDFVVNLNAYILELSEA